MNTKEQKNVATNESEEEEDSGSKQNESILEEIQSTAQQWAPVIRITILVCIATVSILIRVFSVIRYESIIHEFDPWFNYRTTQYLVKEGLHGLWNWFDSESWYPLGRSVGGTVYPGLMSTSAIIYWTLHKLSLPVDIRNVCVFLAPIFSAFTSISAYLMTSEVTKKPEAGLFSALFIAIVPSYISRSVAGSYDNEGVSIFALVFTFYLFLKAVNNGSLLWACLASLAYFYMVAAWGGYAFIINIIPIFVLFQFISNRFSARLYVAYSVFYIIGTFYAMLIPFVGFQAIHSSEHMASHGVFIFLQVYFLVQWLKNYVSEYNFKVLQRLFIFTVLFIILAGFLYLTFTGRSKWSGRSLTLLDPTYAKKFIPIIASVSEHQATTWSSFFFDLHFLVVLSPVGLYYCFKKGRDGLIFCAIYVVLAVYFASVMVRLLLVLAPAVSIMAGIGVSQVIRFFCKSVREVIGLNKRGHAKRLQKGKKQKRYAPLEIALLGMGFLIYMCSIYVFHANSAAAEAYSSPSIILSNRDRHGNKHIIDDYREAYYWLRMNTPSDTKIMSWWDYGYQITGMSNRTVLVDNNTWNNTHIATVGVAMASNEEEAFAICERLDVDYVLVIFGGFSYYSGDDINKFLWMVRIGGGVFQHIKEEDYYNKGSYRIDQYASETMLNSLMYRLSFYRFDEVRTQYNQPAGYDTVRNTVMGKKNYKLQHFEEAFTSENWIVRIFRVKPRENRDGIKFRSKKIAAFPAKLDEFVKEVPIFRNHKYKNKAQWIKTKKRTA